MAVTFSPGDELGPYRIESFLGEGGMGQVFRAADPSLDRAVALKVLSDPGSNEEQQARFLAEARAAASLNHPNICTIYQVGRARGVDFIAMELIHGAPLSARIRQGPLPAREVVRIGAAVASALSAAHEKGILHRDIKPDNVTLTADGTPKLLDFGLAKRFWLEGVSGGASPQPLTTDGKLRGTLSYMSPEQGQLAPLDARSDIFSLGIVLYEMAAGVRPFLAESPTKELIRIVRDEPVPVDTLAPGLPAELARVIHQCLEKDPADRYQHASDLAVALRRIERDFRTTSTHPLFREAAPSATPAPERPGTGAGPPFWRRGMLLAAGLLAGALATLVVSRVAAPGAAGESGANAVLTPVTADAGVAESPSFAPDGETVAYASDRTGDFEIYLRRVSGGRDLNVTNHPADDVQPALSPDGKRLAFISTRASRRTLTRINADQEPTGGDLWIVPPLGGEARLMARDANFPAFSPDSRFLYYVGGAERHNRILRLPVDGGDPVEVLDQSRWAGEYRRFSPSPDGKWLVLGVAYQGIFLAPAEGNGRVTRLDDGARPSWTVGPRGRPRILWTRPDQNVWWREVDPAAGRWTGPAERLTTGRGWDTDAVADATGRRIAYAAVDLSSQIVTLPLDPSTHRAAGAFRQLLPGMAYDMDPVLSPDGQELLFVSLGRWPGPQRVFRSSLARGTLAPLTEAAGVSESNPLFSPDGRWIAFERDKGNGKGEMLVLPREGGAARAIATGAEKSVAVWFPDSRRILFQASTSGKAAFHVASIDGGPELPLLTESFDTMHPAFSPDGQWLAFAGNRDGDFDVFLKPLDGGPPVKAASTPGRDGHPFFSNDSKTLYFQPGHQNIFRVPVTGGTPEPVTTEPVHNLYLDAPRLTPDGQALLLSRSSYRANVWVLDRGGAAR